MVWERGKKKVLIAREDTELGSITIFLCILFLLFFSLTGVAFENVRVLSSQGYMRTAAYAAAMTVFGNYNKELYGQYGFFAYGGYGGKGEESLARDFNGTILQNIQAAPENAKVSYGNLYRIGSVESYVEDAKYLTNKEIFDGQVKACLKEEAVSELREKLKGKISGDLEGSGLEEKLALAKGYEKGEFDGQKEAEAGQETASIEESTAEDLAGGNPLEIFTDMVRDGVLNLVCDAKRLSDGVVEGVEEIGDAAGDKKGSRDKCAADYLNEMLLDAKLPADKNILERGIQKLEYIAYADKQFSSYTADKDRTTKYGMEFLVAGKKEEKDNLSYIVNRLLGIRATVNFACIVSDAALQEKSLATATVLAGFTGMPPVIKAVQYVILLILAFEEACVDVTALLEGRSIPFLKTAGNLKMSYEEICMASKGLFASKAGAYPVKGTPSADITYHQYLYLFLLMVSEENLRNRSYGLIQYDLREKYNQTFCLSDCICTCRYRIDYTVPFLFGNLPFLENVGKEGQGNNRSLEVDYGYKSR